MIVVLMGSIFELTPTRIVMNCSGVCYAARISLNTYNKIKQYPGQGEIQDHYIYVSHIFTENGQVLFGFENKEEQNVFEILTSVSGVGGATALALLSGLSIFEISSAIEKSDLKTLMEAKGIGKKTAERLCLELKGKFKETDTGVIADAISALVTMGYSREQVAPKVRASIQTDVSTIIRQVMKELK
jgi:holliday junction DNA helicase RuvA